MQSCRMMSFASSEIWGSEGNMTGLDTILRSRGEKGSGRRIEEI